MSNKVQSSDSKRKKRLSLSSVQGKMKSFGLLSKFSSNRNIRDGRRSLSLLTNTPFISGGTPEPNQPSTTPSYQIHLDVKLKGDSEHDKNGPTTQPTLSLLNAIIIGDVDVVRSLIAAGANVEKTEEASGLTCLALACKWHPANVELLRTIINGGAAVDRVFSRKASWWDPTSATKQTALHELAFSASGTECLSSIDLLIEHGADIQSQDSDGGTPLFFTMFNETRDLSIIRLLINRGVNINCQTSAKLTPLHVACAFGNVNAARLLIESNADIHAANCSGFQPLHYASLNGHLATVRLLIDKDACVNDLAEDTWTPLHSASLEGHVAVVKLLLDHDADVNGCVENHSTPLHLASKKGEKAVVSMLLRNKALVDLRNSLGDTALHVACKGGKVDIVRLLLHVKADINAAGEGGLTPLHCACAHDHTEIARILLENGAQTDLSSTIGHTSLHMASVIGAEEIVELLLPYIHVSDIDPRDKEDGYTPLHVACIQGHAAIAKLLLDHGAQVDSKNSHGETPLYGVSFRGYRSIAELLISKNADIETLTKFGWTPLHAACVEGHSSIAELLLECGAHADRLIMDCATPLHFACLKGDSSIAELLLKHGAQADLLNEFGTTPLQVASNKGHSSIVDLLLEKSALASGEASGSRTVPSKELESLESTTKFLMETPPYPSMTLTAALEAGNTTLIRRMIVNDFETHANGEFLWLQDLKDAGFNCNEIADILIEDLTDAPWIRFKLPEQLVLEMKPGKHLHQCAHSLCQGGIHMSRLVTEQKSSTDPTRSSNMQRTVQEFCGLGGVRPCSDDKAAWGGTVRFNQTMDTAIISYASPDSSTTTENFTTFSRTINALDQFLSAASIIQAANQCCDSFTVLVNRDAADTQSTFTAVELYRLEFQQALRLSKDLKRLFGLPQPSTLDLECAHESAINIINVLFPVERLLTKAKTIDHVIHTCAIAAQFLCVGLLSYSQAHISPLQPFFMNNTLAEIRLMGSEWSEMLAISAYLVQLSCLGEMAKRPVIVFTSSVSLPMRDAAAKYDILASSEDILDTFGPGKLIFPTPGTVQPCAVSIGGGLITANAGNSKTFHWGREQQLHQSLRQFDPTEKILIGTLWNVNMSCMFDESLCRNQVTLEPLGTISDSWEIYEQQMGLQAGLYVVGTYNSTYCKIAGTTLKERILGKADDMLLLDLEDIWGVQVSVCTAVACRVPLRTLLADVLPIFAQADGLTKSIWESLQRDHDIIANLKLPNFIDFVGQLDETAQRYLIVKIRATLEILQHTGISKSQEYFTVAWPHGRDIQRGIRIACEKESYWTRMLADTSDCATFAYMSSQCLESGHCRCSGSTLIWQNAAKLLITAVSLHQRVKVIPSVNSEAPSISAWALCHEERYIIGTNDIFLKVEVHKPSNSEYALLRPTVLKFPSKYGKRILEKLAEKVSSVARLRERQKVEDEAEHVLVTCHV